MVGLILATSCGSFAARGQATHSGTAKDVGSKFIRVQVDGRRPGLISLAVDSLGAGRFADGGLRSAARVADAGPDSERDLPVFRVATAAGWTQYFSPGASAPLWEIRAGERDLVFRSHYAGTGAAGAPLVLDFDAARMHATLLGRMANDGGIALPAVLHLPGMGSLQVSGDAARGAPRTSMELMYHSGRATRQFVTVGFPAADSVHPVVTYRMKVVALAPSLKDAGRGLPTQGFERDYLDGLQLNAELHVLANNAASDPCPFTLYEAADIALAAPPLAPGLTALDLVRETLDRYRSGFIGYGMPGYEMFDHPGEKPAIPHTFSDVYPSLLVSAYDYVTGSGDRRWLRANYAVLTGWAEAMLKASSPETGLLVYPESGNSGSWTEKITVRPANWWDTIGFGHEDAWSNALGYRALRSMAALAEENGDRAEAARYRQHAEQLKAHYLQAFLNPETGLLAGWRSKDGKLHDYSFLFVNGAAIRYGLLDTSTARTVSDKMLQALKQARYDRFDLGLPGNLKPVRREDYVDLDPRFGGPKKADGSDGFEIYENGGTTAAFAYFTVAGLYRTGHRAEADAILIPMLKSFAAQGFSGRGASGLTNDWKDWHGGAHGYEGFLADNYYALLCALEREGRGPAVP